MARLNQMQLIFKQPFKFLDSFFHSRDNLFMFVGRQSNKIRGSIIKLNSIKVMNIPIFWKWLSMNFFPNNNMLHHVSLFICSMMGRLEYMNVIIAAWVSSALSITTATKLRTKFNQFTTNWTWFLLLLCIAPFIVLSSPSLFSRLATFSTTIISPSCFTHKRFITFSTYSFFLHNPNYNIMR